MPNVSDFTVCLLTPLGRGAIASLAVDGPGAATALSLELRGKHVSAETMNFDRPMLAHFGSEGEQIICVRRGEFSFEIHCHGGVAAVHYCLERLLTHGGRAIDWRDRNLSQHGGHFAAVARVALASAPTAACAAVLLDQLHGALDLALDAIKHSLTERPAEAQAMCDRLLDFARFGLHLTRPWKVVLIGSPNVGKSSLLNALAGYERAIVHHRPGTTRDVVRLPTALGGWAVELCDTAGLRASTDEFEQAGIALARQTAEAADVAVLVFDGTRPARTEELDLLERFPKAVCAINKADLALVAQPERLCERSPIKVSALRQIGIDCLIDRIVASFGDPPPPGSPVPFTEDAVAVVEELRRQADSASGEATDYTLR